MPMTLGSGAPVLPDVQISVKYRPIHTCLRAAGIQKQSSLAATLGIHDHMHIHRQFQQQIAELHAGQRFPAQEKQNSPRAVLADGGDRVRGPPGVQSRRLSELIRR